jgi:hypothetical protein
MTALGRPEGLPDWPFSKAITRPRRLLMRRW